MVMNRGHGYILFYLNDFIILIEFQVQTCSPASISGGRTKPNIGQQSVNMIVIVILYNNKD